MFSCVQVTGIDGNYRITCESVMHVLREHKDSIMAVLEAFVYDPLLNWRLMDSKCGWLGGGGGEGGAKGTASWPYWRHSSTILYSTGGWWIVSVVDFGGRGREGGGGCQRDSIMAVLEVSSMILYSTGGWWTVSVVDCGGGRGRGAMPKGQHHGIAANY